MCMMSDVLYFLWSDYYAIRKIQNIVRKRNKKVHEKFIAFCSDFYHIFLCMNLHFVRTSARYLTNLIRKLSEFNLFGDMSDIFA